MEICSLVESFQIRGTARFQVGKACVRVFHAPFDDDTATGYCLTWLAGPGFAGGMRENGMKWPDALEFRQRDLLEALRKRSI